MPHITVAKEDAITSPPGENENDQQAAIKPLVDRIRVWQETRAIAMDKFRDATPPSEKFDEHVIPHVLLPMNFRATDVELKDVECINEALRMKDSGEAARPLVLNLSDNKIAGGCVELGSGAQEESLWRRTALCVTQLPSFYPLGIEAIYSPRVPVLRGSEREGYVWYDHPKLLDFIACPALRFPQWVTTTHAERALYPEGGRLSDADQAELAKRLRLILTVAALKNHDVVVLGAMGCGAWGNPPSSVARVFARVIPEFNGVFKKIVVAILNTSGPRGPSARSLEAFERVFAEEFGSS